MHELPPSPLQDARHLFWIFLGVLFLVLVLSGCLIVLVLGCRGRVLNTDYLLSGSAGFGVLAAVVALSAYLRNVASTSDEKRENIVTDSKHFYGVTPEIKAKKLDALAKTCRNLQIAAPFMILLSVVMCLRVLLEAVLRFGFSWTQTHACALTLHVADVLIIEWLLFALIGLAVSHHFARNRDDRIRESATAAHESTT